MNIKRIILIKGSYVVCGVWTVCVCLLIEAGRRIGGRIQNTDIEFEETSVPTTILFARNQPITCRARTFAKPIQESADGESCRLSAYTNQPIVSTTLKSSASTTFIVSTTF